MNFVCFNVNVGELFYYVWGKSRFYRARQSSEAKKQPENALNEIKPRHNYIFAGGGSRTIGRSGRNLFLKTSTWRPIVHCDRLSCDRLSSSLPGDRDFPLLSVQLIGVQVSSLPFNAAMSLEEFMESGRVNAAYNPANVYF